LEKTNLLWSTTKKEKGVITLAFISIVLIFTTLSFIIYIYYGFQNFYIKRTVKNSLKKLIYKNMIYNYKDETWYFATESENFDLEYMDKNSEIEQYISEYIQNEFISLFNEENKTFINNGLIKNLGEESKYRNYGQAISGGNLSAESENIISTTIEIDKIDYCVDNNNNDYIDYKNLGDKNLQILDSALKVKIRVRIKAAYPMFLFTSKVIGDQFFDSNGREIKRAYYDVAYIVSI